MALVNRADTAQVRERLAGWLRDTLSSGTEVHISDLQVPSASGLSSEIYTFDASWGAADHRVTRGLVARVAPAGEALFPVYDLPVEHRLMHILGEHTDIPVPPLVGIETDTSILGAPFLVMERVIGRVPSDDPPFTVSGWVTELAEAERETLFDNALRRLADIHRLDWRSLGIDFMDHPEWGRPGIEQQLGFLGDYAAWVLKGRPHPIIDAGLEWARANQPGDEPLVFCWGDARPGNMIFRPDGTVAAILDWELAAIASPELDLGVWLFVQRFFTDGIGAPLPPGFPDHHATAEAYEQFTGHRPVNLHYYEALAGLKTAIVMARFADLMAAAGLLPPESDMRTNNPATQIVATMLDLPAPTGTSGSFIGQRQQ